MAISAYMRIVYSLNGVLPVNKLGLQKVLGRGGAGGHSAGGGGGHHGGEPGPGPGHRGGGGTRRSEGRGQLLAEQGACAGVGRSDLRERRGGDRGTGRRLGSRPGPE